MKKSAQRQRKILTDPHYVSLRTRYNIHFSRFRYEDADINTVGAIGCTLSHVKILKALAAGKISSPAIVFEDDARVPDSAYKYSRFRDYLKTVLPKTQGQRLLSSTSLLERSPTHGSASDEWDMLLLGHVGRISYFDEDAHSKATRGRRIKSFIGCHAIVYTRNLAQKMLPWLFPVEGHIDAMFSRASELGFIHIRHHPSINIRQASQGPSTIQHTKTGVKMIRETNKKYRVQKGATHVLYLMLFIVALISVYTILRVWNRYKECKTRCCSYGAELGTKSIEPKRGYAKVENVS
jgi:GR25 family glycosyltransferase involved in LPS biosynthesis